MSTDRRKRLASINSFNELIIYLRDELGWRIESDDFEELTFHYTPEELGIDENNAAKIVEIRRLRPLTVNQPWGIFFLKFERKRLPVVALRRILSQVAIKKRPSTSLSNNPVWTVDDLLFISSYGEGVDRSIAFAHFSQPENGHGLPTLKVLGWDNLDTPLHLDSVANMLGEHLIWPRDENDHENWRERWRQAFTLRHREVIATSSELSKRLAGLARSIRDRILATLEIETEFGLLTQLKNDFSTKLVDNLDDAEFADMYAQTVTYGLLSARISDPKRHTAGDLESYMRTNPLLKELMDVFLHTGVNHENTTGLDIDFDEIGISEVVDLLNQSNMEAVVRDFGDRRPEEDPVIHFYEHFLSAYDKEKKVERGVFYTPLPVVSYIVRSVDKILRTEFNLSDGLADTKTWGEIDCFHKELRIPEGISPNHPFVQILDPATGTGTFLVEVIDLIHTTMVEKWKKQGHTNKIIGALWNEYVSKHLLPRLHGYELMMAPYAIAHLKIALKLYETGYRLKGNERIRVYLTDALEPASEQVIEGILPALAYEVQAVNKIKRKQRFTVVIGNPPYLGEAGRGGDWIAELMRGWDIDNDSKTLSYFEVNGKPIKEKNPKWLNDLYVRFVRLSQRLIERTGVGVHGFITNHSYIDNPTFRGMRWAILAGFDHLYVLDLHGNLKRKENFREGQKDENVFDIEQGVAIGLFVKTSPDTRKDFSNSIYHADIWGSRVSKYNRMLAKNETTIGWVKLNPDQNFYLFKPFDDSGIEHYDEWVSVSDIFPINSVGFVTARDALTVQRSAEEIWSVVSDFVQRDSEEAREKYCLGKDADEWKVTLAQDDLRHSGPSKSKILPILYRPFDTRFTYYTGRSRGFICRPRKDVMGHMLAEENVGLIFMRQVAMGDAYTHFGASRHPVEGRAFYSNKGIMSFGPLYIYPDVNKKQHALFDCWPTGKNGRMPNLEFEFVNRVKDASLLEFVSDGSGDLYKSFGPEDLFAYIYAVFHCPEYRKRYELKLKLDYPRVPTPVNTELFRILIIKGHELLTLHLLESSKLDEPMTSYNGHKNPRVGRVGWLDDTVWLDAHKITAQEAHRATKPGTIGFNGVPEDIWKLRIGGYQVCHKWLKDRKDHILSDEDIIYYQKIIVALFETTKIMDQIDKVIEQYGGWPNAFQS